MRKAALRIFGVAKWLLVGFGWLQEREAGAKP
jgi:hypothetical protein